MSAYTFVLANTQIHMYIHTINTCSSARNAEGVGSARAACHFIIAVIHMYVVRVYAASGRRRTGSFNLSCAFLLSYDKADMYVGICKFLRLLHPLWEHLNASVYEGECVRVLSIGRRWRCER